MGSLNANLLMIALISFFYLSSIRKILKFKKDKAKMLAESIKAEVYWALLLCYAVIAIIEYVI